MPASTNLDIQAYVEKSYELAGNTDPKGRRYWVRTAANAPDPLTVLAQMDKALGLA